MREIKAPLPTFGYNVMQNGEIIAKKPTFSQALNEMLKLADGKNFFKNGFSIKPIK